MLCSGVLTTHDSLFGVGVRGRGRLGPASSGCNGRSPSSGRRRRLRGGEPRELGDPDQCQRRFVCAGTMLGQKSQLISVNSERTTPRPTITALEFLIPQFRSRTGFPASSLCAVHNPPLFEYQRCNFEQSAQREKEIINARTGPFFFSFLFLIKSHLNFG